MSRLRSAGGSECDRKRRLSQPPHGYLQCTKVVVTEVASVVGRNVLSQNNSMISMLMGHCVRSAVSPLRIL